MLVRGVAGCSGSCNVLCLYVAVIFDAAKDIGINSII